MAESHAPAPNLQPVLEHPAVSAVRGLAAARGIPILLVGGAVRDALLGEPMRDFDFAVQGDPVSLGRAAANRLGGDFYVMDAERGTARVLLQHEGIGALSLDFAACRGAGWEEDLRGRDFTLNAIAVDLHAGAVVDPTGGRADLARRVVRQAAPSAMGDDPVRAVRAVRMALALAAEIEPETQAAVRAAGDRLDLTSPERIRDEFLKILAHPQASRGIRRLDGLGLLARIAPEIEPMRNCRQTEPHRYDVLEHTFVVLDYLDRILGAAVTPEADLSDWLMSLADEHRSRLAAHFGASVSGDHDRAAVYRLAVLLHDCGKPNTRTVDETGMAHFYSHPLIGAELAAARVAALRLSNQGARLVRTVVLHHMRPNLLAREGNVTPRALYRLWRDAGDCLPELALLCAADGMGKAGEATGMTDRERRGRMASLLIDQHYTRFAADVLPPPLVSGLDVLDAGVAPGRKVGAILEAVREAQMAGDVRTREEALSLARQLAEAD